MACLWSSTLLLSTAPKCRNFTPASPKRACRGEDTDYFTVRVRDDVCVMPLPTAVTVSEYVPAFAADDAASVNVEAPEPGVAMVAGAKVAVTPVGSPVIERATELLNPPTTAVATESGVLPAGSNRAVAGIESVKLGTFKVNVAVLVTPPPVAVIVSG